MADPEDEIAGGFSDDPGVLAARDRTGAVVAA